MASDVPGPLRWAIASGTVAGLVLLLRHGYDFATQNGNEPVGMAIHALDPTLLAHDWYMQAAALADVRWATVATLGGLARFTGLEVASGIWFLATAIALGVAFQLLARPLFGASPLPALAAVLLTDRFANLPGLNRVWQPVLTPSAFAIPLAVFGLAGAVAGRPLAAGVACGVSGLFHFQVGLCALAAGACGLLASGRGTSAALGRLVASFGLIAGPAIVSLYVDMRPLAADPAAVLDVLYYRGPWHYLPLAPGNGPGWALLAAWLAVFGVLWWPHRRDPAHCAAAGVVAALVGMGALALAGTYVFPVPLVIKFQFLRPAPLLAGVVALYVGHAAARAARAALGTRADALVAVAVGLVGVVAAGYVVDAGRMVAVGGGPWLPGQRLHPTYAVTGSPDVNALGAWAERHTPVDAIFLVPPQLDGFRVRSHRGVVVDFKSLAFSDRAILEWDQRFQDACGTTATARVPLEQVPHVYAARPLDALRAVARRWGATHVLTQVAHPEAAALYARDGWWVYAATP